MDSHRTAPAARQPPVHVIFLASADPLDVHSFSGTIYYMARALRRRIPELEIVRSSRPSWFSYLQRAVLKISRKRTDPYYWRPLNRWFARLLAKRWRDKRVVVVGVVNAALVAELARLVPVINVSDATYDLMRDAHEVFWSLDRGTAARAEEVELNSIANSVHNSFSSRWAATSAIDHYGARPQDVSVISWGCNFENIPDIEDKPEPDRKEFRLLFIGGEWLRKGGDVVYAAADILAERGVPLRIDFVGVVPPDGARDDPRFHHHGYLSKSDERQLGQLHSMMGDADLLFLPTRQDCTPMVFAEANAYGTPVLTRDVGGVADVVRDGLNGVVLPEEAEPGEFADAIEALWRDPVRCRALRVSARREFDQRLNWDAWAGAMAEVIDALASSGRI